MTSCSISCLLSSLNSFIFIHFASWQVTKSEHKQTLIGIIQGRWEKLKLPLFRHLLLCQMRVGPACRWSTCLLAQTVCCGCGERRAKSGTWLWYLSLRKPTAVPVIETETFSQLHTLCWQFLLDTIWKRLPAHNIMNILHLAAIPTQTRTFFVFFTQYHGLFTSLTDASSNSSPKFTYPPGSFQPIVLDFSFTTRMLSSYVTSPATPQWWLYYVEFNEYANQILEFW